MHWVGKTPSSVLYMKEKPRGEIRDSEEGRSQAALTRGKPGDVCGRAWR